MLTYARRFALSALLTTVGCTSTEQTSDDAAECFEAKCDGFGGAEVIGALSDDALVNPSTAPVSFVAFGTKALYFGSSGRGLWITDGTADGTKLVRDIGTLYFWGDEVPRIVVAGTKAMWKFRGSVWVTDGTPTGTKVVKDFGDKGYADVLGVMALGDTFFFSGENKLWISDGTAEGTSVFSDMESGSRFHVMGGKLYFVCDSDATGREVCVTDGTAAGTKLVAEVRAGAEGGDPAFVGVLGDKLVFTDGPAGQFGSRTPWVTDGTAAGTKRLSFETVSDAAVGALLGNELYFACDSKLCKTDGTPGGTVTLDLVPGATVYPSVVAANGRVFFVATQPSTGFELWSTDGTPAGTTMLDIRPGEISGVRPTLRVLGDRVLVGAHTVDSEEELFISDGTVAGTKQLGEIQGTPTNSYGLNIASAVVVGNKLFFAANDKTHGEEPWITDGTDAGTKMLADAAPPSRTALAVGSKSVGTGSYFAVEDADATLVWRTNGVAATKLTTLEKQILPSFAAAGNALYFAGKSSLWRSDGTQAGTKKLRDLPGSIKTLTALGNRVAFTGSTSGQTHGLWLSDGTSAGTVEAGADNARGLAAANGRLWLTALGSGGNELFSSDGTVAGTKQVADIDPDDDSEPHGFVGLGGKTAFIANDGAGEELWITDGNFTGTKRISDINPGAGSSLPRGLTAFNNRVLFWATASVSVGSTPVYDLYVSDGTLAGTTKLKALSRKFISQDVQMPENFTVWGEYAFFVTTDEAGFELWRTDGSEAGTVRVADIYAGPQSSKPTDLVLAGPNGPLYFVAEEPAGGREPWTLATPTGTPTRLADVRPGPRSSRPSQLQPRGDALVFIAEGNAGPTLFRLGPAPDVVAPLIECPGDIELEAQQASGMAVDFAAPTATDNEGDATIETTSTSGDMFAVGTTTVTATATDVAGNTASCTFDITVTYMGMGGGGGTGSEDDEGEDSEVGPGGQAGGCSAGDHSGAPASFGLLLLALASLSRRRR